MRSFTIEDVLDCPRLPSLSAVAVEVLELTKDEDFDLGRVAEVIQKDQGLTARILRTVNSSYYGLARPCPTISRALAYLGVNTVKSLVLGFNLVELTKKGQDEFDLVAYWRRSLHSAAAAKQIAALHGRTDPEEAFIAALIQDVGVLAMRLVAPALYGRISRESGGLHSRMPAAERQAFGFDHTEAGASLGQRWRLPGQFVEAIRHHHDSEPPEVPALLREVCLARELAAAMDAPDPARALGRAGGLASRWLGFGSEAIRRVVQRVTEDAEELAGLFDVQTGEALQINRLLAEAEDDLIRHYLEVWQESEQLTRRNRRLAEEVATDALTKVPNRKAFDEELAKCFDQARSFKSRVGLILLDVDAFKAFNDTHGHLVGDAVLIELAGRLLQAVRKVDILCRYGGDEFAVIVPGASTRTTVHVAERLVRTVSGERFDAGSVRRDCGSLEVTISAGVAVFAGDGGGEGEMDSVGSLVHGADTALYAAKGVGGNCVRLFRSAGDETQAA